MKKYIIWIISVLLIVSVTTFIALQKKIILTIETYPDKININSEFEAPKAEVLYCNKFFTKSCHNISEYVTITNNVNKNEIGKYDISYIINYKGKKEIKTISIEVLDLEKPIISLNNTDKLTLCPNEDVSNLNDYTVTDNYDSDLQEKVKKYIQDNKVFYSVTDSSGNNTTISKDVEFKDNNKPTITLKGYSDIYILQGSKYSESGAIVYDECDKNISSKVKIEGKVDTNTVGEYEIKYYVEDSSGNKSSVTRTVHVYNNTLGENVKKNGKIVYLTFDDGPNSYTKNILDVLNKYQVKATFFVTNQFSKYQYMIKDIYESGHSIAIHTYSHQYKEIYKSEEAYFADLNKMDNIIYKYTNNHTKLIRFPGGSSNTISKFNKGIITRLSKLLEKQGYVYFDWNVDSGDTSTSDSDKIANNVINGMKKHKNSVVLMHDIKYANKDALEKIIYYGLTNGYTFLPLDENSPTCHHSILN